MEKTIKNIIEIRGNCLYSENESILRFYPLKAYTGIYINNILIHIKNVFNDKNNYFTKVGEIKLTEHLLSALYALGINNLYIECSTDEIPIFDGSSKFFFDLFKLEIYEFGYKREVFFIDKNLRYEIEEEANDKFNHKKSIRFMEIEKGNFEISGLVDFPYSGIQKYSFKNLNDYDEEISGYKTHMNIEYFNNCIESKNLNVLKDSIFVYDSNTKFEGTELIRHKILDVIGDIALSGLFIEGKIYFERSGHNIHQRLTSIIYNEFKLFKELNTKIVRFDRNDIGRLIDVNKLKPYFGLNHFSFDIDLYEQFNLIEENGYIYIYVDKPFDHWSPLLVYTNYDEKDSNYLPFVIREKKNCILYKIDDKIRDINPKNRYYWRSKCNLNEYLKFRDGISKRKHFPSTKNYKMVNELFKDYRIEIEDFQYEIFEKCYDLLKRPEHKPAKEIPIPKIENKYIKLAFLKFDNEILFVAALVDTGSSVSILNLASKLDNLEHNIGTGFLACFKLFEYYCNLNYDSFDLCISRMYGCYKNKLCIERYQFNEILDN